mgnify:CR=1 FL=1
MNIKVNIIKMKNKILVYKNIFLFNIKIPPASGLISLLPETGAFIPYSQIAITSISTSTSFGSLATSTKALAGGSSVK